MAGTGARPTCASPSAPRRAGRTTTITDSHAVAEIFERRYGRRIGVVPYGVEDPGHAGTQTLERLGLEPRKYILFVGRLEPENNPHLLVEAFARIDAERARGMKVVVVGGAPYAHEYIRSVQRAGDPRVLFPGYVFGRGYWELQRHAYLFCAPTEVGGTHPVILEALAAGNCVLVNDHAPERRDGRRRRPVLLRPRGGREPDRAARAAARRSCAGGGVPPPRPASAPGATPGRRWPTSTRRCWPARACPASMAPCPPSSSTRPGPRPRAH